MRKLYSLPLILCLTMLSYMAQAQISSQIVGGEDTDIDEIPWQVIIETDNSSSGILDACGGSIIAPNWILTACHCTFDLDNGNPLASNQIKIYAGISLRSQKNNGQIRNVVEIIRHPDYGTNPDSFFDHDIALLRLSSPLNLNNNVQVIDYARQADADAGWTDPDQIATVSGWGDLSFGGSKPDHLQSVEIPIVDNAVAAAQYDPLLEPFDITDNMLAAGNDGTGGQDACQGDSGGPLVVQDNNGRDILAGIVSFGNGCADPNFMGIYTRVSRYCGWIAENIAAISGPSLVCTSNRTFTLNNLPPGVTVNWSVNDNNLLTIVSTNNTSATIRAPNTFVRGNGSLTATINGECGSSPVTKTFWVGRPVNVTSAHQVYVNGQRGTNPITLAPGSVYLVRMDAVHQATGYNWSVQSPMSIYSGGSGTSIYIETPHETGTYTVSCSPYNGCGSSGSQTLWVEVNSGGGGGPGGPNIANVSPNPNRGTFKVDIKDMQHIPAGAQYQLIVTNNNGEEVFNKETRQRSVQLNLQHVPKGIYQLFIIYGEASYHHRILIE